MGFDLKSYLLGKQDKPFVGAYDLPSWLMGKAQSGETKTLTGTLPLYVRSRASQILQNYIIYGESVQDGTPTPEEPVEVTGLGVRTKNWIEIPAEPQTRGGATLTFDRQTGTVILSGDTTEATSGFSFTIFDTSSLIGGDYIFSGGADGGSTSTYDLYLYNRTDSIIMGRLYNSSNTIAVTIENGKRYVVYVQCRKGQVYNDIVFKPMLRAADTSADFEPYGYKIPITVTSNGTTTDYPVYIGNGQLMEDEYVDYESRKVWKRYSELTLSGDEDNLYYYGVYGGGNLFYIDLPNNNQVVTGSPYLRCNYYKTTLQTEPALDKSCRYQQMPGGRNLRRIYICDNNYDNLSDYRAYLGELYNQGTPLKFEYLLKDAPIPTDPPVPLPDITLPQATVTIDIEGDLKPQATVKGKIEQIT